MFLNHAKQHITSIEHLWCILNLQGWTEDTEPDYKDEVLAGCAEIINKPDWVEKVVLAVKKHSDNFEFFMPVKLQND